MMRPDNRDAIARELPDTILPLLLTLITTAMGALVRGLPGALIGVLVGHAISRLVRPHLVAWASRLRPGTPWEQDERDHVRGAVASLDAREQVLLVGAVRLHGLAFRPVQSWPSYAKWNSRQEEDSCVIEATDKVAPALERLLARGFLRHTRATRSDLNGRPFYALTALGRDTAASLTHTVDSAQLNRFKKLVEWETGIAGPGRPPFGIQANARHSPS